MPNLIWLEWERDLDGYDIVEVELSPEKRRLLDRITKDKAEGGFLHGDFARHYLRPRGNRTLRYKPMDEHPGLFMEFARTDHTLEGMQDFANKFGLLFYSAPPTHSAEIWPPEPKAPPRSMLLKWGSELTVIQSAINVWKDVQEGGENMNLAANTLCEIVNVWWERSSLSSEGFTTERDLSIYLRKAPDANDYALYLRPGDLAFAIKLQFAQAVSNNTRLQRCGQCPTWFSFGTGTGRRKSALYCSDRCRRAAYQQRKAQKDNG